jgi:hypothetical protein
VPTVGQVAIPRLLGGNIRQLDDEAAQLGFLRDFLDRRDESGAPLIALRGMKPGAKLSQWAHNIWVADRSPARLEGLALSAGEC